MLKNSYKVIGVMSGTSLDGVDLAFIEFQKNANWAFKILCTETVHYDGYWTTKLNSLVNLDDDSLKEIDQLYTSYLSEVISNFMERNGIDNLDAVCSHGHTALHQPNKGLTYQIGNLPILASKLNRTLICDFRVQDVELGGQGAPLVPIGDELLFSEFDYCLNLGGFANISHKYKGRRLAYDLCPANIVLNNLARALGKDYDPAGEIARSGNVNTKILNQLNGLTYYALPIPKSLGLEWVNENVDPILNSVELPIQDKLRTFVEHIAYQVSKDLKDNSSVLATGGGAYNSFLMEQIQQKTNARIIVPEPGIIEFKEALIFGLLGVLKLRNEINVLASVTGAINNHSSGKVYYP
ncbi:anhydro-N-acetylmuramic acid kinase [Aegicerativicinus sediminis]|uniref:anhydro-N-acetylmuramic acid kinase n=1 Tax=Aegicerativicinus sediminis TaxID=2893202 RepID=UPI001E5F052D|nr:anhydro-N-acetylmuramic acid kinase [Aegicerativicinus sediminis]